jgi:hypothetical protein
MSDAKISHRVTTISGAKIKYTYNKANREVTILNARPTWGEQTFVATCWDSAPQEIAERLNAA